jgi:hypothetical protein
VRKGWQGAPLVPGINLDVVDVGKGIREAIACGYDGEQDLLVVWYALWRHQHGEEDGAERTWLSEYPHDLTSWKRILSAALVDGALKAREDAAIMDALRGKD